MLFQCPSAIFNANMPPNNDNCDDSGDDKKPPAREQPSDKNENSGNNQTVSVEATDEPRHDDDYLTKAKPTVMKETSAPKKKKAAPTPREPFLHNVSQSSDTSYCRFDLSCSLYC